jgi:translation elongation factor EF-1alpha
MLPHKCTAIVDVRLDRSLCLELFSDNQQFGRFMLRTNSKTVAAGIVTAILSLHQQTEEGDEQE